MALLANKAPAGAGKDGEALGLDGVAAVLAGRDLAAGLQLANGVLGRADGGGAGEELQLLGVVGRIGHVRSRRSTATSAPTVMRIATTRAV